VRTYVVRGLDATFHPKVRRPICTTTSVDCFVIELTFGDIKEAMDGGNHMLRAYVNDLILLAFLRFYEAVENATPDHVGPDDRVFIVYEDPSEFRGDTYVYILFDHFEHCDALELNRLMLELRTLCDLTYCDSAGLEEMSCTDEYILLHLSYATLDRYVNNTLLRRDNPFRRLLIAYMQDYTSQFVGPFLGG